MKKIIKNIIFLNIFVQLSCNNYPTSEIVVNEFPEKIKLTAKILKTKPIILAPKNMFIIDGDLWIFQSQKDTLFDVFRLPDGKYLYSTGTKGKGPDEFLFPRFIQQMENGFSIFDNTNVKITEITDNGALKTVESYRPFRTLPVNGFNRLNDSILCSFAFCGTGLAGEHEYRIMNRFTGKEKTFSLYPSLTEIKYTGDERCQKYYKCIVSNPHVRKFAAFYTYFKYIRLYDYKGNLEKEIRVNIEPYKPDNADDSEEWMMYYVELIGTERYIYALCINSNVDDDINNLEIQVWDWNGSPVIQYSFDRLFDTFTISEKEKKIYTTFEENEDEIHLYDLIHLK